MPTLYVHLDESGNFDFSSKGTRYYVFTATWTVDPELLATAITRLRFQLLKEGMDIQRFHATVDKQNNRDKVVKCMVAEDNWRFVAIVLPKKEVPLSLREGHKFYPKFASVLITYVLSFALKNPINKVIIFTDTIPIHKNRKWIEKALKTSCQKELPEDITFKIYHHDSKSNVWLQITDYCSWAVFRKWEFSDSRTYDLLARRLRHLELVASWSNPIVNDT